MKGGTINQIMTFYVHDGKEPVFSLEIETLLNYLGLEKKQLGVNEKGIFLKDELIVPSPQGLLPLNYLVYPNNFRIIPASSVLEKKVIEKQEMMEFTLTANVGVDSIIRRQP